MTGLFCFFRRASFWCLLWLYWLASGFRANALPGSHTTQQGTVSVTTSGSTMTINQTTTAALNNWSSFNIAQGETVNFTFGLSSGAAPVSWDFISDQNASTLAGTINATKGFVVLQNPNGFTVAGSASINVHNLIMTTASAPPASVTAAGPWSFSSLPPAAQIVNYGQITTSGNGSVYLIASDIVNNGTITAPGGGIGLYAGENVLVSVSPTAHALSAQVTLPQGSVDNEGNLVANAGAIAAMAQYVNQDGMVQANTAQNVNGTIELVASGSLNVGANSSISAGNLVLNTPTITADNNNNVTVANPAGSIELSSSISQADSATPADLTLSAGNNITFDGVGLTAGQNWTVNLDAGTAYTGTTAPGSGNDGIYLNGASFIQTENGDINLDAANEVILGNGGVRTIGGGNITVDTTFGDVNTGTGTHGLNYHWNGNGTATDPYYTPFTLNGVGFSSESIDFSQSQLSGIATAAGGNVAINSGADVISFPTSIVPSNPNGELDEPDPGTGAFGSESGNVTINAKGNVYGNYMLINGTGQINAGGNIGTLNPNAPSSGLVALSLANGGWTLNAGGNIYLQEVRNPNGTFNGTRNESGSGVSAGNHLYDYSPTAYVALNAGNGVYITGLDIPRAAGDDSESVNAPMILPPIVDISAGSGGVTLYTPSPTLDGSTTYSFPIDQDIVLFPSPDGNLTINTTDGGSLVSGNSSGLGVTLRMSDSAQTRWSNTGNDNEPFSATDPDSVPVQLGDENPVQLNISGDMDNITLQVNKLANIYIGGNMNSCNFYGENLQHNDATTLDVAGQIYNPGSFNSVTLSQGIATLPVDNLPPGTANNWYTALELAVDPSKLPTQSLSSIPLSQLASYLKNASEFPGLDITGNLAYDPATKTLTAVGPLSAALASALGQKITVIRYGPNGYPELDASGHFITDTITLVSSSADQSLVASLQSASQNAPALGQSGGSYIVGGTGSFDVTAGSINLGNSYGILTCGNGNVKGLNYSYLGNIGTGANINVNVTDGGLEMAASTIAALSGGDVTVNVSGIIPNSDNVSMDLGSQALASFETTIMNLTDIGLGIYTTGGGNVTVTGSGTVNVDSSRIATFNGGNISVTSLTGNVDAGSGGTAVIPINAFSPSYKSFEPLEFSFASGIVAENLANFTKFPGADAAPGNITVNTAEGDIIANQVGILQINLNGALQPGPTITLNAGTPYDGDWNSKNLPVYVGNINLGTAGAIGGTINAKATGHVYGKIIATHNTDVVGQQGVNATVVAGGTATVSSSSGSIAGTVIGGTGVNVAGSGPVTATLLGQNVSVNGAGPQSTLGSSANATATSQAAAQQSTQSATQQVAVDENGDNDKKKEEKKSVIHVGRVTVIMGAAVPR